MTDPPSSQLAELLAYMTRIELDPDRLRAFLSVVGKADAVAALHSALDRVPRGTRRLALARELHAFDPEAVEGFARNGDDCARHVVAEHRYVATGDVEALAAALRDGWPLEPAAVERGLQDAGAFDATLLAALVQKLGLGAAGYRQASTLAKRVADLAPDLRGTLAFPRLNVALLGEVTVDYVRPLLEAALLEAGILATVRGGAFGELEQAVLDQSSWLAGFAPDVVVVVGSTLALPDGPAREEFARRRAELAALVTERLGSDVLVTNLEALPTHTGPGGAPAWVVRQNALLAEALPERAHVFDLASLVAEIGVDRWFDLRLWSVARQATALHATPVLADRLARAIRSLVEPPVKLIVTDLDNVLWGGTVAEVGADGVQLGGNELGEAHLRLQELLRECIAMGFLVAVCSKNTEEAARSPFVSRPEMLLGLDDFAAFEASFLPKSVQLPEVVERLNLGLQSVLFLDDEPHERAEMRDRHPEVRVPEWPEDGIVGLPTLLARTGWLTRFRVTAADELRGKMVRDETTRQTLRATYANLGDFLGSLDLVARVTPIGAANIDRVTQLVQKTNQFNLTTPRYSRRELEERIADGAYTAAVEVEDRYGPYGLTGALVAGRHGDTLAVDLWLMSCRVMGKTVELAMFEHLLQYARTAGIETIEARYRPTDKNGAIASLLPDLGFELAGEDAEGHVYRFAVKREALRANLHVTLVDELTGSPA